MTQSMSSEQNLLEEQLGEMIQIKKQCDDLKKKLLGSTAGSVSTYSIMHEHEANLLKLAQKALNLDYMILLDFVKGYRREN